MLLKTPILLLQPVFHRAVLVWSRDSSGQAAGAQTLDLVGGSAPLDVAVKQGKFLSSARCGL